MPGRHLPVRDQATRNALRRLFGFVAGMRPTLLAQTGLGTVGADHLGRDGRVAWRVAMETLSSDARREAAQRHREGECSVALDALADWVHMDLELETLRWYPAEMTLRHFHYVLTADGPMRRQDERCVLLGTWAATLSDLVFEIRAGDATLGRDGVALINRLGVLADNCAEADLVRHHLDDLLALVDVSTPSPLTYPLAPPCLRDDLRSLLEAASTPALIA